MTLHGERRPVWPGFLIALPLLVGATFSARQVRIEFRANAALEASRTQDGPVPVVGADASPRELVYTAEALTERAVRLAPTSPERSALLKEASGRLAKGITLRPLWGEAWVIKTHLLAIMQGLGSQDAARALQTSYELDPFLRDVADWRLQYAIDTWSTLSSPTRKAVSREAIMLSRVSRDLRAHVRVMSVGTPLYPLIETKI